MKRIMVMGVAPGAGKSTLTRELGKRLLLPIHHYDKLYWNSGWIETEDEVLYKKIVKLVRDEYWIIDGNYSKTEDLRFSRADILIFLNTKRITCLFRICWRYFKNRGKVRDDMTKGCVERIDWQFIKYTYCTHKRNRDEWGKRSKRAKIINPNLMIITLSNTKEINRFLSKIEQNS